MKIHRIHLLSIASILSGIALAIFVWQFYFSGTAEWRTGIFSFVVFGGSASQLIRLIKSGHQSN